MFPTVVAYVIDTPRCHNPATFMSNMLYACSIMYKTKLPFILVFNKTDMQSHQFAIDWMTDFEAFQVALQEDESYMGSMVQSMGLLLEEFYRTLRVVGVSAFTGDGMDDFFAKVSEAVEEYERDYRPAFEAAMEARRAAEETKQKDSLNRLMKDLSVEDSKDSKETDEAEESESEEAECDEKCSSDCHCDH